MGVRFFRRVIGCIALMSSPMLASTITIQGTANIFAAGQGSVSDGTLPPSTPFAGSNLQLIFSSVTGLVNCCSSAPDSSPDGGFDAGGTTNINSLNGISGIVAPRTLFLVGLFDNGSVNAGAAPARLDFSANQDTFTTLSPLLYQTFFIGDGRTGFNNAAGTAQVFAVPIGATRLFLGFADAYGFQGDPSYYFDNTGSLTATFAITPAAEVPEPSTFLLTGLAGLLLATVRKYSPVL